VHLLLARATEDKKKRFSLLKIKKRGRVDSGPAYFNSA
jgi:hypothetical protein